MFEQIRANQRQTAMLVAVMAFLLIALGYTLGATLGEGGGIFGLLVAFFIWGIMTIVSYFGGGKILLTLAGARKIEKQDHPILFNVVEEMCIASGLSRLPDIYIIDDDSPNAFATGRDHKTSVVAVTSGLLKRLDRNELQGVIAHEIGHVNNYDILYMMMIGVMVGTIVLIADFGRRVMFHGGGSRTKSRRGGGGGYIVLIALVLVIIAPLIARFLYFAISRKREYLADACAAQYTRYPDGLASALEKIGAAAIPLRVASDATAPMYIVNPMKFTDITSTHPPLSERIRILRSIGAGGMLAGYNEAFRKVTGRPVGIVPRLAVRREDVAPQKPAVPAVDPLTHIDRVRQTTDLMWSLQQYAFITCPCDTKLKIPPAYAGRKIECPHCGTLHAVAHA